MQQRTDLRRQLMPQQGQATVPPLMTHHLPTPARLGDGVDVLDLKVGLCKRGDSLADILRSGGRSACAATYVNVHTVRYRTAEGANLPWTGWYA